MTGYIYSLSYDNSIFYVGSTLYPNARLQQHRTKYGYLTQMEVIEEASIDNKDELIDLEIFWSEQFRQWGFSLKNKDAYKSYKNAPSDIVKYIREVHSVNKPYDQLTSKNFDEIVWQIIRTHRDTLKEK